MAIEDDNDHASNVGVTVEQATEINEADVCLPEDLQTGVVSGAEVEARKERKVRKR